MDGKQLVFGVIGPDALQSLAELFFDPSYKDRVEDLVTYTSVCSIFAHKVLNLNLLRLHQMSEKLTHGEIVARFQRFNHAGSSVHAIQYPGLPGGDDAGVRDSGDVSPASMCAADYVRQFISQWAGPFM